MLKFSLSDTTQSGYDNALAQFCKKQDEKFNCEPVHSETSGVVLFEHFIEIVFLKETINRGFLLSMDVISKEENIDTLLMLMECIRRESILSLDNDNVRESLMAYYAKQDKTSQLALLLLFAQAGFAPAQEVLQEIIQELPFEASFWNSPLLNIKGFTPFWILTNLARYSREKTAEKFFLMLTERVHHSLLDWNAKIQTEKSWVEYFSVPIGTSPFSHLCAVSANWREKVLPKLFSEVSRHQLDWTAGSTRSSFNRSPFWLLTTHAVKGEEWAQDIFDKIIESTPLTQLDGWYYSEEQAKTPYEQLSQSAATSFWAAKALVRLLLKPAILPILMTHAARLGPESWAATAVDDYLRQNDISKIKWNAKIELGSFDSSLFAMLFSFLSDPYANLHSVEWSRGLLERIFAVLPLNHFDWNIKRGKTKQASPFLDLIRLPDTPWKIKTIAQLISHDPRINLNWNEPLGEPYLQTPLHYLVRMVDQKGHPELLISFLSCKKNVEEADFNVAVVGSLSIASYLTPPLQKAVFLLKSDVRDVNWIMEHSKTKLTLDRIFKNYWTFQNMVSHGMPLSLLQYYVIDALREILLEIPQQLHKIIIDTVIRKVQNFQASDNDVKEGDEVLLKRGEEHSIKSLKVTARLAALKRSAYTRLPTARSEGFFRTLKGVFNYWRGVAPNLVSDYGRIRTESILIFKVLEHLKSTSKIPYSLEREQREDVINHLKTAMSLNEETVKDKVTEALKFSENKKRELSEIKSPSEAPLLKKRK